MDKDVRLQYGTLDQYKALEEKDDSVLYFLTNHHLYKGDELISNVHTIEEYPETPTAEMRLNFYIKLDQEKSEIRYVTEN